MWCEKYRPRSMDEFVGSVELKATVQSYIDDGDIPNMLLSGKQGSGKTTLAYIIANEILDSDIAMNFTEINASDDRSIEKIRKIVTSATRHVPFNGKPKIMLLDEADGLLKDAQNAMRRPMEKASRTRFILTANDVNKIIAPVRSRCVWFPMMYPGTDEIVERLQYIRDAEGAVVSDEEISRIAKESEGDIRYSINELEKRSRFGNRYMEVAKAYMGDRNEA